MGFTNTRKSVVVAALLVAASVAAASSPTSSTPQAQAATPSTLVPVGAAAAAPMPATLSATGLYVDGSSTVAPHNHAFTPQYPLWTDGATKRRWIHLPDGAPIDASSADDWQFPVGTKLWKEFSFGGRRVETRYAERVAAGFRFATYVWNDDDSDATIAPVRGGTARADVAPGVAHQVPSEGDCRVCHTNSRPVLGFSALQMSGDRDALAPHRELPDVDAWDLPSLVRDGRVIGHSGTTSPVIAARSATERAALGYLHGNCGGCHNHSGTLASLGMWLAWTADGSRAVATTAGVASHVTPQSMRIDPGHPERSVVVDRMRARDRVRQMPPLGTQIVDDDALQLVTRWIREL